MYRLLSLVIGRKEKRSYLSLMQQIRQAGIKDLKLLYHLRVKKESFSQDETLGRIKMLIRRTKLVNISESPKD